MVRFKNKIRYPLPDRNYLWLDTLFALYATRNGTWTITNTKREIARCSSEGAAEKLLQKKQFYLKDENHQFYEASKRLDIKLSGSSHDIFAADIFYYQSCYFKYVHLRSSAILDSEINYVESTRKTVLDIFF